MKRDMDLVREILLDLERRLHEEETPDAKAYSLGTHSQWTMEYHLRIMREAGLIDLPNWRVLMTWAGHEFLDQIRDASRWAEIKTVVKEKTGALTFDGLKEITKALTQMALKAAAEAMLKP